MTLVLAPSTRKPRSFHAPKPPASGRTRSMPLRFNSNATRALVASFGQVQNKMISRSRGIWPCPSSIFSGARRMAPGIVCG